MKVWALFQRRKQIWQLRRLDSRLRRFPAEVNLHQHIQRLPVFFGAHSIESFCQSGRVKRMNYVEKTDCPPRLVRLQMAHQMPTSSVPSQFTYLFFRFLDSIFTQVLHTQSECCLQRFGWVRFGDGNESYLCGRPAAGPRGCLNSGANVRESVAQRLHRIWFRQHPGDNTIEMKL
jgi:hypothetical protein